MAMQAGMVGSKMLLLLGAGVTGTILFGNTRGISDLLSDLSKVLSKHLKDHSEDAEGHSGNNEASTAALTAQVRKLTNELRMLASQSSRPITVLTSGDRSSLSSYVMPVAFIGAAGYGYMWWRGIKFGDLMYVTKRSMSNAVASVTKQLEIVSSSLASTRRQLTGKIDHVSKSLDESKQVQDAIQQNVSMVQGELGRVGEDVLLIQHSVQGLQGQMSEFKEKQDFANTGIMLLCRYVKSMALTNSQPPDLAKGLIDFTNMPMARSISMNFGEKGLKELFPLLEDGLGDGRSNGNADNGRPKTFTRSFSNRIFSGT